MTSTLTRGVDSIRIQPLVVCRSTMMRRRLMTRRMEEADDEEDVGGC